MRELLFMILLGVSLGYIFVLDKTLNISGRCRYIIYPLLLIAAYICPVAVFNMSVIFYGGSIGGYFGMKQYEYYQHKHDRYFVDKYMG